MPKESAQEKSRRYITEGRMRVLYVKPSDPRVRATCFGDGQTWRQGYDLPPRGWWCDCPAKTTCSHLLALRLVVEQPNVEVPF